MKNIDVSRIKQVSWQLIKEFWLPFILATMWTIFSLDLLKSWVGIIKTIGVFGPAFFLFSWLTGQVFRVIKQTAVESNFKKLNERFETVVSMLEKQLHNIIGLATGKDSYVFFKCGYSTHLSERLILMLYHFGEFPVYDISADIREIVDDRSEDEKFDSTGLYHAEGVHFGMIDFKREVVQPGYVGLGELEIPLEGKGNVDIHIWIATRSNSIKQHFKVRRKSNGICLACRTFINGKELKEERFIHNDFPGYDPLNPDTSFSKLMGYH